MEACRAFSGRTRVLLCRAEEQSTAFGGRQRFAELAVICAVAGGCGKPTLQARGLILILRNVTKSRNNYIKMGDHGKSEYRTSRFTGIEPNDIFKARIAYDSKPYLDFMAGIIFGEECRS
jgi:hypothetical protein